MMSAAEVSAAKPWMGCSFTILCPIVRMMRQPPAAVPAAMVSAPGDHHPARHDEFRHLQKGKPAWEWVNAPACVPVKSASVMIPMVFLGVIGAMAVAHETRAQELALAKTSETMRGEPCSAAWSTGKHDVSCQGRNLPSARLNIGSTIFGQRPLWAPFASTTDHLSTAQRPPRPMPGRAAQTSDEARDWNSTAGPATR